MIAEIEKALVGALALSQKSIIPVLDTVRAEDFSTLAAQMCFNKIVGLWKDKQQVDIISVCSGDNSLLPYLTSATSDTYAPAAAQYAAQVAKEARARRLREGLNKLAADTSNPDYTLEDMLSLYQKEMRVGRKDPAIKAVLKRVDDCILANKQRGRIGISTGFSFMNKLYIQYVPGHIWTIGGFTSAGKTAVMVQKICNLIVLGECPRIVVISTEMTEEQVIARMIANLSGVHSFRILSGNYHDAEEEDTVAKCRELISLADILIYDDIYTAGDIETAFRKADLQGGIDIGFIDYVQNCKVPDAKSQYQEQADMAKRFQQLAKDVRATLICLSQVSNDVGRGNTDQLELKGAGEWAAVSDIGIMLQRHKTDKYKLKYQIKKNRHGALGEQILEYRADYTRLVEVSNGNE